MRKLPRTFCVTLKETPLRTKGFVDVATNAGIDFTFFHGIFGPRLGLSPTFPNSMESSDPNIVMNERALGCNMSHFILWNVLKYLPDDEFLIFEDDAVFESDFIEKFWDAYDSLPADWKMVYVGWLVYGGKEPPVVINEKVSIRTPSGTHAYLIKKSLLVELMAGLLPFQSNIDLTIANKVLPKIPFYVFDPSLVSQRSYLNTTDPVWTSLVYDWKNDLYGCKKQILQELELTDGWHQAEQNGIEYWRWSRQNFIISIPEILDTITILCTVPVENVLVLTVGLEKMSFDLKVGKNEIVVHGNGNKRIEGSLISPFIPEKVEPKSGDSRELGICLKKLVLNVGPATIPVEISELGYRPAPPFNFNKK